MSLTFTVESNPRKKTDAQREAILENSDFGKNFTDHMVTIRWSEEKGWHDARVQAYGPIELDPATSVLHYGQAIFEGLKAYRQPDGTIATFRPTANAARMQRSADRLAMPQLPEEDFVEAIRQLVDIDQDWVPSGGGEAALYIRPYMFSTETTLGVKPSSEYLFVVIASPSGAYFADGISPVSVWLDTEYVRAAPGGTGAAKFAGNYAASLVAQAAAAEKGCQQVVWLDATHRKYIEEMGGMNMMFVYGSGENIKLVTPALSGSLLAGVTRDSLLQVAQDLGYEVEERLISVEEWQEDVASGAMTEALACGTAAVITPIGHVKGEGIDFYINDNKAGEVTMKLREALTSIQQGKTEDTHGWRHTLVN